MSMNYCCHLEINRGQNLIGFADYLGDGPDRLYLGGLIDIYAYFKDKEDFFTAYFDKLAGGSTLREQIESGLTEAEIRLSWQDDLDAFQQIREKYLIYPE